MPLQPLTQTVMLNTIWLKQHKLTSLLIVLSVFVYAVFAYDMVRTDHLKLVLLYTTLFACFYKLVQSNKNNFKLLVALAIISRLVFLLAIPNLSQDFYRFIWDGQVLLNGLNPYLTTPDYHISQGTLSLFPNMEMLHQGMGALNSSHFTNYPPVNQVLFALANLFPGTSILSTVIGLRMVIILADIGAMYFGAKLLKRLQLPVYKIFWYVLNPFILIELTGNLHFEGVMLFFLILSLYLLNTGKWKSAAVVFALSISTKLVPLLFLPLFVKWFTNNKTVIVGKTKQSINFKKLISFYAIIGITTLLLFAPFFSTTFITNYSKTVGLWFGNFEFNASFYYIVRAIGYSITGYNEIAIIGKALPILVFIIIWCLALTRKNQDFKTLLISLLLAFTCYLFFSTTVHPWYVATILLISIFTNYKFPLVWSFIIIISYLAYANANNTENLWIIGLEYLVVFSVFVWEVFLKRKSGIKVSGM